MTPTREEVTRLIERLRDESRDDPSQMVFDIHEAADALRALLEENERLNTMALDAFKAGCEWERKLNEEPASSAPEVGNGAMGKSVGAAQSPEVEPVAVRFMWPQSSNSYWRWMYSDFDGEVGQNEYLLYPESAIKQLQAERDAYKKDAERYRWLRKQTRPDDFYSGAPSWEVAYQANGMGQVMRNEKLDAAIDAAMKQEKE